MIDKSFIKLINNLLKSIKRNMCHSKMNEWELKLNVFSNRQNIKLKYLNTL